MLFEGACCLGTLVEVIVMDGWSVVPDDATTGDPDITDCGWSRSRRVTNVLFFLIFKSNLKSNLIEKRTWIVRYWPYLLLDVLTDGREADGGRSVAGRATFSGNFCALAPRGDGAVWEDWGDFGKGLFLIVVNFLFVITRLSPRIVPEIKLGKGW